MTVVGAGSRLVLAALLALAVGACSSGPSRGPVAVTEASIVDGTRLGLALPSCNGDPELTRVEENAREVRVEVVSTVHPDGDACADGIEVQLADPLRDRPVIDLTTGDRVEVRCLDC